MTPERWRQVKGIFDQVVECAPEQRADLIRERCATDEALLREVQSLLACDGATAPALQSPLNPLSGGSNDDVTRARGGPEGALPDPVTSGAQLGPYRIETLLGSGGMGHVYKARDTRLGREVAIKIMADRFSGRSEREAQAIASLNHSHICTLYDVGPNYLVMEYVEGETLASRLKKGPLPLDVALRYGAEIADALAAAHSQGIVHRDLKPGNIMLTRVGVKLLDFGLAQVGNETTSTPNIIMGTLAYMAPEQREGRQCDARTDIYALGLVVHEMVTGKPRGRGPAPPIAPQLMHFLNCCLAEDPADRWQAAADVKRELEWAAESRLLPAMRATSKLSRPLFWTAMAIVVLGVLAALAVSLEWFRRRFEPPPTLSRFQITAPEGTVIFGQTSAPNVAVAPDGRKLAFAAQDGTGKTYLWVHDFASFSSRRLDGAEGARNPFWLPDSQFIGYFDGARIRRISHSGGASQSICEASSFSGGTWNRDGIILFPSRSGLQRVSATGGAAVQITTLDKEDNETGHEWPQLLPDGKHFLYLAKHVDAQKDRIYVQAFGSSDRSLLLENATRTVYALPGYLLFVRGGTLFGQSLDLARLRLRGEPFSVAEGFGAGAGGMSSFTVSDNGVLAFRSVPIAPSQIVWYDRQGRRLRTADGGQAGEFSQIGISPDGRRLIIDRFEAANASNDFWLLGPSGAPLSRLTLDPEWKSDPLWSPDSQRIVFSLRNRAFYETNLVSGATTAFYSSPILIYLDDWSRDGRFLVYHTSQFVFLLPMFGERKPQEAFRHTGYSVDGIRFSPDGAWLAYNSNETGVHEVYAASLDSTRKRQISRGGGVQPFWREDGAELFYLAPDAQLMAVDIRTGTVFESGIPRALFQTGLKPSAFINAYAATGDGKTFLTREQLRTPENQIKVVLNWNAGVRR